MAERHAAASEEIVLDWAAFNPHRTRLVVIVDTPHRVGSTWTYLLLGELGNFTCPPIPEQFEETETIKLEDPLVLNYLRGLVGRAILKSHSMPIGYEIPMDLADDVKFLTVLRDPRDVIVSMAFYASWFEGVNEYTNLSDHGKILKTIEEASSWLLPELEAWFRSPTPKLRYEDLSRRPVFEMRRALNYVGLAPLAHESNIREIERIVDRHSFRAQTGREPGQEIKTAFIRKGIVGDWKNYFDEKSISAFKATADGRWNRLLVAMGYESALDW